MSDEPILFRLGPALLHPDGSWSERLVGILPPDLVEEDER